MEDRPLSRRRPGSSQEERNHLKRTTDKLTKSVILQISYLAYHIHIVVSLCIDLHTNVITVRVCVCVCLGGCQPVQCM